MGVFADKKFEELDWISQATEPIESHLNLVLEAMPDELIVDFPLFKKLVNNNYDLSISTDKIVQYFHTKAGNEALSYAEMNAVARCFGIFVEDNSTIDFENEKIYGEIKFVKLTATLGEDTLKQMLGKIGIDKISSMWVPREGGLGRANEIMEFLGKCEDGLRSKSDRKKIQAIRVRLTEIFKTNEWNIKDTQLANKVGEWIYNYVVDGDLSALSNFCRLKVMTHLGQPIYSMEEIK